MTRATACGLARRALLTALVSLGFLSGVRADDPQPPSEDFLEYLGTIEAEDDDWTLFDAIPPPPDKEKTPPPENGDKP